MACLDQSASAYDTFETYLKNFDRKDYYLFAYHIAIKPEPATGRTRAKQDKENEEEYKQSIEDLREKVKKSLRAVKRGIADRFMFIVEERSHQFTPDKVIREILEEIEKRNIDMVVLGCGRYGSLNPGEDKKSRAISDQVVNKTSRIALVMSQDFKTNFIYDVEYTQHVARLR